MPRFPAKGDEREGWEETAVPLGERLANRQWVDVITGVRLRPGVRLASTALPLRWGVLFSAGDAPAAS